jgi:CheY-like chemotaxis protein
VDGFMLVEQIQQSPDLSNLTTIMLTSGGQRGDGLRCKQLGIAAYLIKPVLQADLLEALLQVLSSSECVADPPQVITQHTLREARLPLRILLAEDNVVNQKLASRLLEKQGHTVSVAADGAQTLSAWKKESFDLILMDAQMPVMDGFEATAAIRKLEEHTRSHIPIIAMTAHALVGDRNRCLEAGMDGYIPKPIRPHELYETIETVLAQTTSGTATEAAGHTVRT